jgi:hypothetical protein
MALEQDAKKGKPVFCIDLLSFCDESRIARGRSSAIGRVMQGWNAWMAGAPL